MSPVARRLGNTGKTTEFGAALASCCGAAVAFQFNLNTETLGQVITTDPICLEPHTPVRDAFRRMNEQRRGAVLVCRAGVLAGIFTERDAVTLMADGTNLDVPIEQAVATEAAAHLEIISGPEILSQWVGGSEAHLRQVFARARAHQPAVILIDELDALAGWRDGLHPPHHAQLVAQLLVLLDGLDARGQVVVLATTNRLAAIDPAILRPGRFDAHIAVPVPDRGGRLAILHRHAPPGLAEAPRRAISMDILDFRARVLAIEGSKLRLMWTATLIPDTVRPVYSCDRAARCSRQSSPDARARRSPGSEERSAFRGHAAASRDGHVSHDADRFASARVRRAVAARAVRSAGTASPVPKYISGPRWPADALGSSGPTGPHWRQDAREEHYRRELTRRLRRSDLICCPRARTPRAVSESVSLQRFDAPRTRNSSRTQPRKLHGR